MAKRGGIGVEERHARVCASGLGSTPKQPTGKRCNCAIKYRASKKDPTSGKLIRCAWTGSRAQAITWREEAVVAVRQGRLRAGTATTVRQAGEDLITGMRSGAILDRSGKPYKPKTIRGYEHILRTFVYPSELGSKKVSALRRADVQRFIEDMRALGPAASTIHNRLDPIRVIVRRAMDNEELMIDPCSRLDLPVVRNNRTRIEAPAMAESMIALLPESEQAFWALALYAGLRRGELRGLWVDDVDFENGLLHVRRGWDDVEGPIDPKTFAATRDIPMMGELRRICRAHKLATGRHGEQLFLGRSPVDPFFPSTIRLRAMKAWGWKPERTRVAGLTATGNPKFKNTWAKVREDALEPLTPHEARHCAASYMIAAGMDWKKITEFIGHSDVRTTYNRYGKVVPEDLAPAAAQLDTYFASHRVGVSPSGA